MTSVGEYVKQWRMLSLDIVWANEVQSLNPSSRVIESKGDHIEKIIKDFIATCLVDIDGYRAKYPKIEITIYFLVLATSKHQVAIVSNVHKITLSYSS